MLPFKSDSRRDTKLLHRYKTFRYKAYQLGCTGCWHKKKMGVAKKSPFPATTRNPASPRSVIPLHFDPLPYNPQEYGGMYTFGYCGTIETTSVG